MIAKKYKKKNPVVCLRSFLLYSSIFTLSVLEKSIKWKAEKPAYAGEFDIC